MKPESFIDIIAKLTDRSRPTEGGKHSAFSFFELKPFDYKTNKNLW
ncbi:MAG: hypothetical protein ACJ75B_21980 [Flavisolibacter sp.]